MASIKSCVVVLLALTSVTPIGAFVSSPSPARVEEVRPALASRGACQSLRGREVCTRNSWRWACSRLRGSGGQGGSGGQAAVRADPIVLQAQSAEGSSQNGEDSDRQGNEPTPGTLTQEQREEALKYIGPELLALHTAKNGTVNYKALSKLVPLRADQGELEVLMEDDNLIAVSKPQGMAMNPPHRFLSGTLVNRMLGYLGGEKPPYVLHRLDMWTSGVVVFSKNKTVP